MPLNLTTIVLNVHSAFRYKSNDVYVECFKRQKTQITLIPQYEEIPLGHDSMCVDC